MAETSGKRRARLFRGRTTHRAEVPHVPEGTGRMQREVTIASATLVNRDQVRRVTRRQSWQKEAWELYDQVSELGFAANWLGKALSRCRLYIGEPKLDGAGDPAPLDNPGTAGAILQELHGGTQGQSEMLRRIAVHLSVPGETYLIGMDQEGDTGTRWLVASTEEFSGNGGKASVAMPEDGRKVQLDPDQSTIIRLWQPHPRFAWEADSSVRFCRTTLREINGLTQRVQADIDSRLAGAGVLFIPQSTSMATPNQSDSNGTKPLHDDPFVAGLIEAMLTSIQDRDDASAVVPIVARVPDEAIGKVQHVSFSTPFDAKLNELREAAIRRFAASSDLPAEIITGLGDTNHWSAWGISEQAVKLHVEPMLSCIVQALTTEYLHPALRAAGESNPERYVIWFDTSELSQRPDRSKEAQAAYEAGELKAETLLRENGFSPEDDAPDDRERARWLATRLVMARPELLPQLAPALGLPTNPVPAQPERETVRVRSTRATRPALASAPSGSRNEMPEQTTTAAATPDSWMLATVEQAALRALELAGKRMLTTTSRAERHRSAAARQVHAWDIHTVVTAAARTSDQIDKLLAGAFDVLDATLPDQPCIREAVEAYCRSLLATGRPHRREYLAEMLTRTGCLTPAA